MPADILNLLWLLDALTHLTQGTSLGHSAMVISMCGQENETQEARGLSKVTQLVSGTGGIWTHVLCLQSSEKTF